MSVITDHRGKHSAMRVGLLACLSIGGLVVVCGLIGFFLRIEDAVALVNAGALLMGSSGFAKALQARHEDKKRLTMRTDGGKQP